MRLEGILQGSLLRETGVQVHKLRPVLHLNNEFSVLTSYIFHVGVLGPKKLDRVGVLRKFSRFGIDLPVPC